MRITSDETEHREKRRRHLRKILQRAGRALSTEELHQEMLEWADGTANPRTTRRDLFELKAEGFVEKVPEESGQRRRSHRWKLGKGSFDLALSPQESMTLSAIFQHAERFGFWTDTKELTKLREYAAWELKSRSSRHLVAEGRIITGTRFTVLEHGQHDHGHLKLIQDAMIDDHSLTVRYRPRDAGGVECSYLLKPLALAYQDSNIYLSAFVARETWHGDVPDPGFPRGKYSSNGIGKTCALMLHRMLDVRVARDAIQEPEGFDVRSIEVQRDLITVHGDETIELVLRLKENLHNRLTENALAANQQVERDGDRWLLRCELLDTQGLRLFLMSNAADVEVVSPLHLRCHVREQLETALAQYAC